MKLLITGATGQLGTTIARVLAPRHELVALSHADLDITKAAAVADAVPRTRPDAIINCAAYNDVDGAEDDTVGALGANAFGVLNLARAAQGAGAAFVHYSSDFVFDGRAAVPYQETDAPNPESVYAVSKLLSEWFAAESPRHYVLRLESLFGGGARNGGASQPRGSSLDRIVDALIEGREVRAFTDRTVSPSFVDDVARATEALLTGNAAPGLYHCVSSGHATWMEVVETAARLLATLNAGPERLRPARRAKPRSASSWGWGPTTPDKRPAHITATRMADVQLRARRPAYCALSNAKLAALGIEMPSWQDALKRYLKCRLKIVD